MKKFLYSILCCTTAFVLSIGFASNVKADEEELETEDGLIYEINDDNTVTIIRMCDISRYYDEDMDEYLDDDEIEYYHKLTNTNLL